MRSLLTALYDCYGNSVACGVDRLSSSLRSPRLRVRQREDAIQLVWLVDKKTARMISSAPL